MIDAQASIQTLIEKAAAAETATEAMQFSQAATNIANARAAFVNNPATE